MKRRSLWFWILTIVVMPLALGVAGLVGATVYAVVRTAPLMNQLAAIRDPRLRMARLGAASNPDMDVTVDQNAGTMTLRDKKTGDLDTINYADIGNGPRKTAPNLPSWVDLYPGASPAFVYARSKQSKDGGSEGAKFILTTVEPASKVMAFYQEKVRGLGLKVETSAERDWEFLKANGDRRWLSIDVQKNQAGKTEIHLEYEEKQ